MCLIVIPARYASSRFPGKPLVLINDKPMVINVYERALKSKFASKVIIATDDNRIFNCAKKFKANVEMTSSNIKSGSDRVYQIAKRYDFDIIVNLQGDEPFIDPNIIDNAILTLKKDTLSDISTPVKSISNMEDIQNPNIVKAVFNSDNYAIYFSRSPIPFHREHNKDKNSCYYHKHIGIYCYRKSALEKFVKLPVSNLEQIESLEQLRAIEAGMKIKIFLTDYESMGIDTPEDLEQVKKLHYFQTTFE